MLPLTQAQAVAAIARPFTILAPVVVPDAVLLPLGQRIVVGVVVIVSIRASTYSPEHLINLGLRRPTSAYRVVRMLLDTADHGGVGRPAVHRSRLRQDYGTARRIRVVRRPSGVGGLCSTNRATGHEPSPHQDPNDEQAGTQVFHVLQPRKVNFQDAMTGQGSGGWTFVRVIG